MKHSMTSILLFIFMMFSGLILIKHLFFDDAGPQTAISFVWIVAITVSFLFRCSKE